MLRALFLLSAVCMVSASADDEKLIKRDKARCVVYNHTIYLNKVTAMEAAKTCRKYRGQLTVLFNYEEYAKNSAQNTLYDSDISNTYKLLQQNARYGKEITSWGSLCRKEIDETHLKYIYLNNASNTETPDECRLAKMRKRIGGNHEKTITFDIDWVSADEKHYFVCYTERTLSKEERKQILKTKKSEIGGSCAEDEEDDEGEGEEEGGRKAEGERKGVGERKGENKEGGSGKGKWKWNGKEWVRENNDGEEVSTKSGGRGRFQKRTTG